MAEQVSVFWVPGCTSCLRTKEFLTARGVDFESVDVANDPNGAARLEKLGARGLPVVAMGERWVYAQSTRAVADFVGVPYGGPATLSPTELMKRYDKILSAALRFAPQIPAAQFHSKLPKRDRTYGDLSWHIFRIAEAFLESATGGMLTFEALAEGIPNSIGNSGDVVAYGKLVHGRLIAWWAAQADRRGDQKLQTFYGEQRMQEVLERSTWHSGQHLRQMMLLLDELGIKPDGRLSADDLKGLPLPVNVWDDKLEFATAAE